MWKIENPEIKAKVNQFFSDEEIDVDCHFQMENESEFIDLLFGEGEIQIRLQKNYFKKEVEYKPDDWNPYPEVTPPSEGDWLVQDKYGDLTIREFHVTYGPEGCDKWWENTPSYYPEAVAFRALPEKYVEH